MIQIIFKDGPYAGDKITDEDREYYPIMYAIPTNPVYPDAEEYQRTDDYSESGQRIYTYVGKYKFSPGFWDKWKDQQLSEID